MKRYSTQGPNKGAVLVSLDQAGIVEAAMYQPWKPSTPPPPALSQSLHYIGTAD